MRIEGLFAYLWENRDSPQLRQPSVIAEHYRITLDPGRKGADQNARSDARRLEQLLQKASGQLVEELWLCSFLRDPWRLSFSKRRGKPANTSRVPAPTQALEELWLPYWGETDSVELRFSPPKHLSRHPDLPAEGYYSEGDIEASSHIKAMLSLSGTQVVSSPSGHQAPAEQERSRLRRTSLIVLGTPDTHPLIPTFQAEEKLRYRVRVENAAGQIAPHVEVLEPRGTEEERYTDAPLDASGSEHVRYCVLTRYVQPLASRPVTKIVANSSAAVRAVAEKISDGRACVETVQFLRNRLHLSSEGALPDEFQVVFATVFASTDGPVPAIRNAQPIQCTAEVRLESGSSWPGPAKKGVGSVAHGGRVHHKAG